VLTTDFEGGKMFCEEFSKRRCKMGEEVKLMGLFESADTNTVSDVGKRSTAKKVAAKSRTTKNSKGKVIVSGKNDIKNSKLTYDKEFKKLFTKREFLSPILKNIVPEYNEYSLEQIEGFITPRGDETINPEAYRSEDTGKGSETTTHYDVLVDCALPGDENVRVGLFFDFEMQRSNTPGYSIPKRGVYYCCRLISRQISVLGDESYDKLRPVYSVWVLVKDIPDELRYSTYSVDLTGSFSDKNLDSSESAAHLSRDINLIHLRLIYLSQDLKIEDGQSNLVKYLQSVFTDRVLDADCNPYHEHSKKIKEEVSAMLSAARAIEVSAREEGREEGRVRGIVETLLKFGKTDTEIVQFVMEDGNNTLDEDAVIEIIEECMKELK